MNFSLRLLMAELPETYSAEEFGALQSCLRTAPGVEEVTALKRHPKGGYVAVVQLKQASYEPLIEYLWVAGYRPAI